MPPKNRATRTVHIRMPLQTLVGIYDFLEAQGYNTLNLPYSSVISTFCHGVVKGAMHNGEIPTRTQDDLAEVLNEYRQGQDQDDVAPTTSFIPPGDEPNEELELEEAVEQVIRDDTFEDSEVHLEADPDKEEVQSPDELAQEIPPWELTEYHTGQLPWSDLKEGYSQKAASEDEAYSHALRVIVAQVPKHLWCSLGTKGLFSNLHKEYQKWLEHESEEAEKKRKGG